MMAQQQPLQQQGQQQYGMTGSTGGGGQMQAYQQQQPGTLGVPSMGELFAWDPFARDPFFREFGLGGQAGSSFGQLMPFGGGFGSELTRTLGQLQPMKVDITEGPTEYLVKADVPGFARDQVKIEVDDRSNLLHISTERRDEKEDRGTREGYTYHRMERTYGNNYRALRLPQNADASKCTANVLNGVLNVRVPKREGVTESGRRRVDVA
jgi:HSP20 family protein